MNHNKALWLLGAMLASLMVAIVAGVIFSATGKTPLEALLYGGGVFGASVVVCSAVITIVLL
ncbi:hypothetical protein [Streptomyces sp. PTD9-10]|uniref:hypothetical protein n=1 Tax=Streptomyces sp. PTD9-10 TaxID=3120151 RepID=UPI0030089EDF